MKNIFARLTVLCTTLLISNVSYSQLRDDRLGGGRQISAVGTTGTTIFKNELENNSDFKYNDIYLFSNFDNTSSIKTSIGEEFKINNINYNTYTHNFESKMSVDSVFIFDNSLLREVKINHIVFKKYYNSSVKKNKFYQVVYESGELKLLKEDKIVRQEIRDALGGDPKINYSKIESYYIKKGDKNIESIKLKEKTVLKLFDDKKKIVSEYVKKNKLSYKKEIDLVKIFRYYISL